MTRVSAILTSYNVDAFIATAMQSVIDCEFEDLELILVDDGSTDATRQVADRMGAIAPPHRVQFIPIYFSRNTPGGVATAANAGLDRATGDIVAFVDGDDWVIPDAFKRAVELHSRRMPDVTVCGCKEYWNDTGEYTRYPEAQTWDNLKDAHSFEKKRELVLQLAPFPWRKIYSRGFLERTHIRFPIGPFFYEDNPFHWETSLKAESFEFFRPDTHVHRMARAGQTVSNMGFKPLKIFDHAKTIKKTLESSGKHQEYAHRYLDWLLEHILWCARYVPAEALNALYDLAVDSVSDVKHDRLWNALETRKRTPEEVRQLSSIFLEDRMSFLREF